MYFQPLDSVVSELPNLKARLKPLTSPGVTPQQSAAMFTSSTATTALAFEGRDMEHLNLVSLMSALRDGFSDDEYSRSNAMMAVVMQKALGNKPLYLDVIEWLNASLDEMNLVLSAGGKTKPKERKFAGTVKVIVEKNHSPEGLLTSIVMVAASHPNF